MKFLNYVFFAYLFTGNAFWNHLLSCSENGLVQPKYHAHWTYTIWHGPRWRQVSGPHCIDSLHFLLHLKYAHLTCLRLNVFCLIQEEMKYLHMSWWYYHVYLHCNLYVIMTLLYWFCQSSRLTVVQNWP